MGVPFFRLLFDFVPSPLTFFEFAIFNLSSKDWMLRSILSVFLAVVSSISRPMGKPVAQKTQKIATTN
jgi:hypothetical protein